MVTDHNFVVPPSKRRKSNKRERSCDSKKTRKIRQKTKTQKTMNAASNPWIQYGMVWSPRTKKFVRIGSPLSIGVIRNELERNNEWRKRVQYLCERGGKFGEKLKNATGNTCHA